MRGNGEVLGGLFRFQGGQIERIRGQVPELFQPDAQPPEVAQVPVDLVTQRFSLDMSDSHHNRLQPQNRAGHRAVESL
jgi:hypothetical protein